MPGVLCGLAVLVAAIASGVGRRRSGALDRERQAADVIRASLVAPSPTERELTPADVLGAWRFYIDGVASTVVIDLQQDGRYSQQIVGNDGESIPCPGGAWTLEGPYLTLTGYYSPIVAQTQNVRWFFGDWQNDLALFVQGGLPGGEFLIANRPTSGTVC